MSFFVVIRENGRLSHTLRPSRRYISTVDAISLNWKLEIADRIDIRAMQNELRVTLIHKNHPALRPVSYCTRHPSEPLHEPRQPNYHNPHF